MILVCLEIINIYMLSQYTWNPCDSLITQLLIILCSFFFQIWKYYTITTVNPWSQERKKIFCDTTYLEKKSFRTVQGTFCRKFDFYNYPQKSHIYRWVQKFQVTGSVINFKKKAENLRSGRKLIARCPVNVDVVRDSVGRRPKKSLRRRSQELGLFLALLDKVNEFLLLAFGLTFLKWYETILRQRWKMHYELSYKSVASILRHSLSIYICVFNWNHFEMRLLNLRINFFYLLRTFYPHLGSFCVVFLSLRFGQISPLAFFRLFYRDLG